MLYLGRKGRLVKQPPLPAHTQLHDLFMHYENHPEELPSLPPLEAPWKDKVRTHTSFQGLPWEPFETPVDSEADDYEQLEHVGDALLNRGTGRVIFELYPRLAVGEQTAVLAVLIANLSIAYLSRAYRLPDELLAHMTQKRNLQENVGIQADLLESYIGGVYRQYGARRTLGFVETLFRPLVIAAYEDRKRLWAKKVESDRLAAAIKATEAANAAADDLSEFIEDETEDGPTPALRDHTSLLHQYGARRRQQVSFVKVGLYTMTVRIDDVKHGAFTALEGDKKNWSKIRDLAAKDALINLGVLKADVPKDEPLMFVASAAPTDGA